MNIIIAETQAEKDNLADLQEIAECTSNSPNTEVLVNVMSNHLTGAEWVYEFTITSTNFCNGHSAINKSIVDEFVLKNKVNRKNYTMAQLEELGYINNTI